MREKRTGKGSLGVVLLRSGLCCYRVGKTKYNHPLPEELSDEEELLLDVLPSLDDEEDDDEDDDDAPRLLPRAGERDLERERLRRRRSRCGERDLERGRR